MDLMGILVWLAVLVSLVVFIVMVVKSAKAWGALHVTLLVTLFIQVWCCLFFAAGVASRRNGYMRAYKLLKEKVEDKEREVEMVRFGDKLDPNPDLKSYVPLTNELNRLLVERGRVWRGASVAQVGANEIVLQLTTNRIAAAPVPVQGADPANADAAGADSGLSAQAIVHAFGERNDPQGLLPTFYLGEFVVSESNAGAIKLQPTSVLTSEQTAAIASGTFPTWSIYELMPLDSHDAFAAEGSKPDENAIFGRMDRDALASLLGIDPALADVEPSSLSVEQALKARVLASYLKDGGRPPEGTPPEQIHVRIEFVKDHTIEVDAQEQRNATEGGFFDLSGRSVDARLKRGEDGAKVSFKSGDRIVLDSASAENLIMQGIAKSIAPIFVRELNDYEYGFREVRRQITAALQDAQLIERELAEMNNSLRIADAERKEGERERDKLDKDFAQYKLETKIVTAEAERLAEAVATTSSELNAKFREIQSLRDAIVAKQRALTEAINTVAPAADR